MTPEEKSTKHWLGENIQDTIEDGFTIRCDDITTFRKTPGNGVEEPKEDCEDTADHIRTADIGTESVGVAAAEEDEDVHNVQ